MMKLWLRIGISFCLIILALVVISFLKIVSFPAAGKFTLITVSTITLTIGIGLLFLSLFQYAYVSVAEERRRKEEKLAEFREEIGALLVDLFRAKPTGPKVYEAAEKLTLRLREAADFLGRKKEMREVYDPKFMDRLVAFRAQTGSITKHHKGGEYLHRMRKDFYDGKIDYPVVLKATFRFLEGMKPYGEVAKTIYPLIKRIF